MTEIQNANTKGLKNNFEFYRDKDGSLVAIPAAPHLNGFLAQEIETKHFVQIRVLKSTEQELMENHMRIWNRVEESNDCAICPEILGIGVDGEVPYYISSLPAGEPVTRFIKRFGPLPTEVAANLVLKFIRTLEHQDPVLHDVFQMSPESMWVARTAGDPRIVFGEISALSGPNPEAANSVLCLELLKYLSGNPPLDEDFQKLCNTIDKGPGNIGFAAEQLEKFTDTHQSEAFWTDYNQPPPMLHQLVPPEVAVREGCSSDTTMASAKAGNRKVSPEVLKKILVAGIAFVVLCVLAACAVLSLRQLDTHPLTALTDQFTKIAGRSSDIPTVEATKPSHAPVPIAPPKTNPGKQSALPGESESNQPLPVPVPPELASPKPSQQPNITRPVYPAESISLDSDSDSPDPMRTIRRHVETLATNPASTSARTGLGDAIDELKQQSDPALTSNDLETLNEAGTIHPGAYEVIAQYHQDRDELVQASAALVRFGRSTGSGKALSRAGKLIFDDPKSGPEDKSRARGYFLEAADRDDLDGLFFAAECLILGRGGDKDLPEGVALLEKAVELLDPRAMDLLGVCLVRSWGIDRNDSRAVELFQNAVERGNIPAHYNLGARYAQGQGVERNPKQAADLFETGSELGDVNCMVVLARCYETGFGRDSDPEKTRLWFSRAARKGNPDAIEWCQSNEVDYLKVAGY